MKTRHAIGVIIPFLLAIGARPALADPLLYTISFNLAAGAPLPTSGSFYYDSSTSIFTNFDVVWDGNMYDLTAGANAPNFPYAPGRIPPCTSGASGGLATFELLTTCQSAAQADLWFASDQGLGTPVFGFEAYYVGAAQVDFESEGNYTGGTTLAYGSYSVEATPEPGSCALMLIGVCLVMRKRISLQALT